MYFFLLIVSFIFLFFFSKETSPFFYDTFYGGDSAVFVIMGELFIDGKIPYVDFFDHKGPTLIYMEALGLLLTGDKTGVFILQVVSMSLSLFFIYKTSEYFTKSMKDVLMLIFTFFLFFRFTMVEGNLTEEYSLLYATASIYMAVSFYYNQCKFSFLKIVILALCFCIPFWMRANNASIVCACFLFILYIYAKNKDWKSLYKFVIVFIASVILISLLICLYFIINDALYDMIYASFLFNLKYVSSSFHKGRPFALFCIIATIMTIVFICGICTYYRRYKDRGILVFCILLFVVGFLPLCVKKFFPHYLDLAIPILLFNMMLFIKSWKHWHIFRKAIPFFLVLIILIIGGSYRAYKYHEVISEKKFIVASNKILEYIPDQYRNNTYCYMVCPKFHLITNIKPIHKNYVWQEAHQRAEASLFDPINKDLNALKPAYIIVGWDVDKLRNEGFKNLIKNHYTFVKKVRVEIKDEKENFFLLYKLNNL